MRNALFIFPFAILAALDSTAQGEPRFFIKAHLSGSTWQAGLVEAAVSEPIEVSFILENGKSSGRFSPPDWEAAGFVVLGSSQSSSISIMNGATNASASYNYTISPADTGTLTIPSVSIKIGNDELHTEPMEIRALPNANGDRPGFQKRSPAIPKSEPKKKIKTIRM